MNFFHRLGSLFRENKRDADMAEEMRLHVEHLTQRHIKDGMSPKEARFAALRRFGAVAQLEEECRDERRARWLDDLAKDLRYALRMLGRNPGFTAVALVTLALGIGANTAIFSVLNSVVLRPLPLGEPERLVSISETNLSRKITDFSVSYPNYVDWKTRSTCWENLAAFTTRNANLLISKEPEWIRAQVMTSNLIPLLHLKVALGRSFQPEEDQPGRGNVTIISHDLWNRSFASDPDVLGRTILIDGAPHTVVGVAARDFGLAGPTELFTPLGRSAQDDRSDHQLEVVGRLKPGVPLEQAAAEMDAIARQIEKEYPETNTGWNVQLSPLADTVVGRAVRGSLFFLMGAVGLLLLIACANFSSLILVRTASRGRELAIRATLGGGRGRLTRQLLTESLLLSLLGGAAGVLLASWMGDGIRSIGADMLPRVDEISLDLPVLAFTCIVTLVTGLIAGLIPAWQVSRMNLQLGLQQTSSSIQGGRRTSRNVLIVAQLALSIVLLASAGLMLRTLDRLHRIDLGFSSDNLLTLRINPTEGKVELMKALQERVSSFPGVEALSVTSGAPMTTFNTSLNVFPVGEAAIAPTESVQSHWRIVNEHFFPTMRIPLLKGRLFKPSDDGNAAKAVIVNERLAKILWADRDPIGRQVNLGGGNSYSTVIGVVGDIRSHNPALAPIPSYYMSAYRGIWGPMTLIVRTRGDVQNLVALIRQEVKSLAPTLPLFAIKTMNDLIGERVAPQRGIAALLSGFAGVALVLAMVGLYGVMAYATSQRTREVGVRLALGAQRRDVIKPLIREGLRLIAIGTGIGLVLAFAAGQVMRGLLTDVSPTDPLTFTATALLLGLASLIACYLPARRATKVDPLIALRAE